MKSSQKQDGVWLDGAEMPQTWTYYGTSNPTIRSLNIILLQEKQRSKTDLNGIGPGTKQRMIWLTEILSVNQTEISEHHRGQGINKYPPERLRT